MSLKELIRKWRIPDRSVAHGGIHLTIVVVLFLKGLSMFTAALFGALIGAALVETSDTLKRWLRGEGGLKPDNYVDYLERNLTWFLVPALLPGWWGWLVIPSFAIWYFTVHHFRIKKGVK